MEHWLLSFSPSLGTSEVLETFNPSEEGILLLQQVHVTAGKRFGRRFMILQFVDWVNPGPCDLTLVCRWLLHSSVTGKCQVTARKKR